MILIWNIRTADHTTTTITTNKHSNTPTYARKNESVLKTKRVQIYIEKVFASLAYGVRSLFLFFFIFTFAYSCARLILMQSFLSVSLLFSCFSCSLIFSHTHMRLNFVFFVLFFLFLITYNDGDIRSEGQNLIKRRKKRMCLHNHTQQ